MVQLVLGHHVVLELLEFPLFDGLCHTSDVLPQPHCRHFLCPLRLNIRFRQ